MKMTVIFGLGLIALVDLLATGETPQAQVVAAMDFKGPLLWQGETDVGLMHFYAGDELWTVDLLEGGRVVGEPLPLAGIETGRDVHHLPRTGVLLVVRAQARGATSEAGKDNGFRACAINAFSGKVLWESPPLPTPDEVFHFPEHNRVVLRSTPGDDSKGQKAVKGVSRFTAIDMNSGAKLWEKDLAGQAAWVSGSYLEVIGLQSWTLDSATGEGVRSIKLPLTEKSRIKVFPELERVVIGEKKTFDMMVYPRWQEADAVGKSLPLVTSSQRKWRVVTEKKWGSLLGVSGQPLGPKYVSDKQIMLNLSRWVEVVDFETGETIWELPKVLYENRQDFIISPEATRGVMMRRRKVIIYNMHDGSVHAVIKLDLPGSGLFFPRIHWQSENEVVIVLSDPKARPHSISRVLVKEKQLDWTEVLPKHAKYKMTSKEKGRLAGQILLAATMTAVSANNPMGSAPGTFFIFIPNLEAKQLPNNGAGLEALAEEVAAQVPSAANLAIRRYLKRAEMIQGILGREGLFVTGRGGEFTINRMDMVTGKVSPIGSYGGDKIHGIEPDAVYGLAVSHEQNRRQIKILALGEPR